MRDPSAAAPLGGDPLSDEALVRGFRVLRLGTTQARVYARLRQAGPLTARRVADDLKINRSAAYALLHHMTETGLLHATVARPARFRAAPLEPLIDREAERLLAALRDLAGARAVVAGSAAEAGRLDPGAWCTLVPDGPLALAAARRLVEEARLDLTAVSTTAELPPALERGLVDATTAAVRRGVAVRMLARGSKPVETALAETPALWPTLRRCDAPSPFRFLLADRETLLAWTPVRATEDAAAPAAALRSTLPGVVAAFAALSDQLWSRAVAPFKDAVVGKQGNLPGT